jgi:glutaminyl-peptide cyclotransferase
MKKENFIFDITILFSSIFILLLASCQKKEKSLDISAPGIDPDYAFSLLKKGAAIKPRHSGTIGAKRTVEFITGVLQDLDVKNSTNIWNENTPEGKINFTNIIAEVPGKDNSKFIIIGCHYDGKKLMSVPQFEGANDGASGVAALLAMIKAIKDAKATPPLSLKFLFFDGEECIIRYTEHDGLYGSRHYAQRLEDNKKLADCAAVIILDMIGDKDLNITLPAGSDIQLTSKILKIARLKKYSSYFSQDKNDVLDDHSPFQKKGVPAIDIIDFHYGKGNRFWHTEADTVDKTSPESLKITSDTVLSLIWNIE